MGDQMFLIIDVASLVMGLMLIVAPGKVYNMGKQPHEKKEIPPRTRRGFIIFGVAVVIVTCVYLYFDLFGG